MGLAPDICEQTFGSGAFLPNLTPLRKKLACLALLHLLTSLARILAIIYLQLVEKDTEVDGCVAATILRVLGIERAHTQQAQHYYFTSVKLIS